ncbi:MAG TPA: hypothetical protein VFX35_07120, partial [Solirubrobacterales bacterium]|nr:hypothetical protein [Solirubrobacterales bacterium]
EVDRPEAGGGRLTIAAMKLSVTFAGNPCVYQGSPTLMITGAAEAELAVTGATLSKQAGGFLCPNSFALTATYRLSAPAPLYVSWPSG